MVMTTKEPQEKEKPDLNETREITFKCKYCGKEKPLNDMRMITLFFPPLVACQECERRMW